jgi:putative ABC transport system substrate-binding protein
MRLLSQGADMRRREFLGVLSATVAAWPFTARAQRTTMPVIGWLSSESASSFESAMRAFRQGLSQGGYVEGRNVTIEFRWAEGQNARLPELAADLVRRPVALIATHGPGHWPRRRRQPQFQLSSILGVIQSRLGLSRA